MGQSARTQERKRQQRSICGAWFHLAFHVRGIAGQRHLPLDLCTRVYHRLVLSRSGRVLHIADVGEELMDEMRFLWKCKAKRRSCHE